MVCVDTILPRLHVKMLTLPLLPSAVRKPFAFRCRPRTSTCLDDGKAERGGRGRAEGWERLRGRWTGRDLHMAAYVPSQIKADLKRQDRVCLRSADLYRSTPWARNTVHSRSPVPPWVMPWPKAKLNIVPSWRGIAGQPTRAWRSVPELGATCITG